jgi:hypothetical protein
VRRRERKNLPEQLCTGNIGSAPPAGTPKVAWHRVKKAIGKKLPADSLRVKIRCADRAR